jgi:hypothetical protein
LQSKPPASTSFKLPQLGRSNKHQSAVYGVGRQTNAQQPEGEQTLEDENYQDEEFDSEPDEWEVREALAYEALPEELRKTQKLYKKWSRNYKVSESKVLTATSRPFFPSSEWKKIVRGQSVDLDIVYSASSTQAGESTVHHFIAEDVQLEFQGTKPSDIKKIADCGQWNSAFRSLRRAYLFLMPWRERELDFWNEFMQQLFNAIPATAHSYLFEFDRHVRQRLATNNCNLLSDTSWYEDYRTTYVTQAAAAPRLDLIPNSSGSTGRSNQASSVSRQSRRSVPYKSGEICRNFNQGICRNSTASCRYVHKCASCGGPGHRSSDLDKCSRPVVQPTKRT